MKHLKLPITSLLVLATALVLAAGTPVLAHNGEHHGDDDDRAASSSSSSGSSSGNQSSSHFEAETEHGAEIEIHRSSQTELKQKAQSDISERKQNRKSQTDDQRKKMCESRKNGLNTRSERIVSNSKRLQTRIDGILQKSIDYKTNKDLSPENWDDLLAAAQSAQTSSSASITALEGLKPTVDCNNTSVAGDVAIFKAAAAETRDNLKAYRDSVKALLKSLSEVKSANDTAEGSN